MKVTNFNDQAYSHGSYQRIGDIEEGNKLGYYKSKLGFAVVYLWNTEKWNKTKNWILYIDVIKNGRQYTRRIERDKCFTNRSMSIFAGKFLREVHA